jgi:cytochrome c556
MVNSCTKRDLERGWETHHRREEASVPTVMRVTLGAALAGALVAVACAPRTTTDVEPRMADHFTNVSLLYGAAAAGDLVAVHAQAGLLLARETGAGMPRKAQPYVEEMRTFTGLAARAPDHQSGASAVARVGAACGSCHKAMKRVLAVGTVTGPPEGDNPVETRMIRHQWAADRLWDGLVGPSDVSWQAGAAVLRDAPMYTDELTEDVEQYAAVTKLAWQVHETGALANTVTDQTRRAELYGTLLATCATCHDLLLYAK